MEKLPVEILYMIFGNLSVNDLLRCRGVCKKWFLVVQGVKIRSLAISDDFSNVGNYFGTYKPIRQSNLLIVSKVNFYKSKFMRNSLARLKQLFIRNAPIHKNSTFNLQIFENFPLIEHLEIDFLKSRAGSYLRLPNLKILSILHFGKFARIHLITPELTKLKTEESVDFRLIIDDKVVKKITHLSLHSYELMVRQFESLEFLSCKRGSTIPANDILNFLPSLKELHTKEIIPLVASDLIKQMKVTRRLNFNFYFCGVQMDTSDDVTKYIDPFDNKLRVNLSEDFNKSHLKLSKYLPYAIDLDYNRVIDKNNFVEQNPIKLDNFFKKFINIHKVNLRVDKRKLFNFNLFRKFISKCTYIDELNLINVSFPQSFYEDLKVFCPYLTNIQILETEKCINNIDFIFAYSQLISFSINQQVSFNHIQRAFQFASFNTFGFKINGNEIEVCSIKQQKSRITVSSIPAFFNTKFQMLDYLKLAFFSNLNYVQEDQNEEQNILVPKRKSKRISKINQTIN